MFLFMSHVHVGCLSVFLHRPENRDDPHGLKYNIFRVFKLIGKDLNLILLVLIYAYSNTMQFKAVALVGAPTYSVVMQSKIFFTAGFGVLMLAKTYSYTKWRALALLVVGCILVSSPLLIPKIDDSPCKLSAETNMTKTTLLSSQTAVKRFMRGSDEHDLSRRLTEVENKSNLEVDSVEGLVGLAITLSIAVCSGFSSVYFEKILKKGTFYSSSTGIWDRNFQLAFYSSVLVASMLIYDSVLNGDVDFEHGFPLFRGWSGVTVLICFVNSVGGLLVAATLKYADAILKCFASAVSIIVTSLIGYLFLGNNINLFSGLGMVTTVISILNYNFEEKIEQKL